MLLSWWKQTDLNLMGKTQQIKTFVLLKLVYVSSFTPLPPWAFREIEMLTTFYEMEKIKSNGVHFLDSDKGARF